MASYEKLVDKLLASERHVEDLASLMSRQSHGKVGTKRVCLVT
jgi:hypothetical protein